MRKLLQAESTLTDRYQTTIPEQIREALHLGKRDKIKYVLQSNGQVLIARANEENDPVIGEFLAFIANDMKNNPYHIRAIDSTLLARAKSLVSNMDVDLDAPLSEKDE